MTAFVVSLGPYLEPVCVILILNSDVEISSTVQLTDQDFICAINFVPYIINQLDKVMNSSIEMRFLGNLLDFLCLFTIN